MLKTNTNRKTPLWNPLDYAFHKDIKRKTYEWKIKN